MAPQIVKPYVKPNKNDANDADQRESRALFSKPSKWGNEAPAEKSVRLELPPLW
jgi:hypothetical protein